MLKAVIFSLFITLTAFADYQKITKYADIDLSHIDSHSIVLLDIDNTIFRANGHYGSAEYFDYNVKEIMIKENLTKAEAGIKFYDNGWLESQSLIETKLIDKELPNFIAIAKSKQAIILAFTARHAVLKRLTKMQIDEHDLQFSQLNGFNFDKTYDRKLNDKDLHKTQAILYKGIIFTHDLNPKGDVLKDFLSKYNLFARERHLPSINNIYFVDDRDYNLQSMAAAAKDMNIKFYGYHIGDNFKYDNHQAKLEENILKQDM